VRKKKRKKDKGEREMKQKLNNKSQGITKWKRHHV
jgi:hypothetical protein